MTDNKLSWQGTGIAVQPRIRLTRSFDQRYHTYLGYMLRLEGEIGDEEREFLVGISQAAQAKHQFQIGDTVSGQSAPVTNPQMHPVDYYKTSSPRLIEQVAREDKPTPPPWHGVPPELAVYRWRGHRRLNAQTYAAKCGGCIWSCRMAVEIIVDQWNPKQKRYRSEAFCYGPKSCSLYKAGPVRKVPGRKGMFWEEEDWVDEGATAHRTIDE